MLINLLDHLFKTKIQCSAVSSDGYSPENLISADWRERNQGFLAAHFIKPPVHILFQLPFPTNIESISIKPKVGSQVSCGFDVLVAGVAPVAGEMLNLKRNSNQTRKRGKYKMDHADLSTSQREKSGKRAKKPGMNELNTNPQGTPDHKSSEAEEESLNLSDELYHKYSTVITADSCKVQHYQLFTLVCRLYEPHGRNIIIRNKRFEERPPIQGSHYIHNVPHGNEMCEYEFCQAQTLNYVTHVLVHITRVGGASVPAIGKMDIIGQVSAGCNSEISRRVIQIHEKVQSKNHYKQYSASAKTLPDESTTSEINSEVDIPAEFLDPITCSLMTIPILLPSGLNVDTTTLDKYIEAERQWGRLPSDPFTGLLFTDSYKPVANGALKARVDKYILTSGVDVSRRGRTVGSKNTHRNSSRNCTSSERPVMSEFKALPKDVGNFIREKKSDVTDGHLSRASKSDAVVTNNKGSESQGSTHLWNSVAPKGASHEEHLSLSLENALKETLSGLSFTRPNGQCSNMTGRQQSCSTTRSSSTDSAGKSVPSKRSVQANRSTLVKQRTQVCVSCETSLRRIPAFQLPCKHLMCRACVTRTLVDSNTCRLCSISYKHSDIVRVHSTHS